MAEQVRIYPKLERQLGMMERQGNVPAVAAQRARQIIEALIRGEGSSASGLMRAKSDRRVKNSLKFNLGQGFRLICIKEKKTITMMFAGDHDSSDAWLDANTRKRPHRTDTRMAVFSVARPWRDERSASAGTKRYGRSSPEDDPLNREIPEHLLRQVFRGLCAAG
ncbi:MAG TPA: hypothetical protein DHV36_01270 [Desulfobacteraceae bacterium]|nr:hypothetical protein [Desulfobacteraceae bacterium]